MEKHDFKRPTWMGIMTLWRIAHRVCGNEIVAALVAEFPFVKSAEVALDALGIQPGEEITGAVQIRFAKFENAERYVDPNRIYVADNYDPKKEGTDRGPSCVWVAYTLQDGQAIIAEWRWVPAFDQFALAEVSLEPIGQRQPFDVAREIRYTPTAMRTTLMPVPTN